MTLTVFSLILPVSVCCEVLGFSTFRFEHKTLTQVKYTYCCVITALFLILCTPLIVMRFCNVQATYVSIILLLLDTVTTVIMTTYRVKFVKYENVGRNILDSLDCVDKRLAAIGITVPHMKDHITCYAHFAFVIMSRVYFIIKRNRGEKVVPYLQYGSATQLMSAYSVSVSLTLIWSGTMLLSYVLYLLYIIQRRLTLVHYAIRRLTKSTHINTAWSVDGRVFGCLPFAQQRVVSELHLVYYTICRAYSNVIQFYKVYFNLNVSIVIFMCTVYLLSTVIMGDAVSFLLYITFVTLHQLSPSLLCASITRQFQSIHSLLNRLYHVSRFDCLKTETKTWILQSVHKEITFDCGYFTMDFTLYDLVFQYVSLFILSMI